VVSEAGAFRSVGSLGTSGITKVCIEAVTIPAKARTATITPDRGGADAVRRAGLARAWDTGKASIWTVVREG
jgi:uncharacterized RmlC-like cupin family protein